MAAAAASSAAAAYSSSSRGERSPSPWIDWRLNQEARARGGRLAARPTKGGRALATARRLGRTAASVPAVPAGYHCRCTAPDGGGTRPCKSMLTGPGDESPYCRGVCPHAANVIRIERAASERDVHRQFVLLPNPSFKARRRGQF